MSHCYTSTFTTVAKIVSSDEQDRFIAKASLEPLKKLLPADVVVENNPDLLYFAANGAVAGLVNKNGDAVSCETALALTDSTKYKYISVDHDRDKVVGVIIQAGYSKFGTNEPISAQEAAASKEPFNMSIVGALWKVVNPMLSKYLVKVGDSVSEDALSLSWEIAFDSFDIGVGSKNVFDAEKIAPDDVRYAAYEKILRLNGGTGLDSNHKNVFRIINGNPVMLGFSVVPNPAAAVKGIIPIEPKLPTVEDPIGMQPKAGEQAGPAQNVPPANEIPASCRSYLEEQPETGIGYHLCDVTMQDGAIHRDVAVLNCSTVSNKINASRIASLEVREKSAETFITPSKARVTLPTTTMKIESLEQLATQWDAFAKLSSTAAVDSVRSYIADHLAKEAEKWAKEHEAKEKIVQTVEAAKQESEKKVKELETSLSELKTQLATLKDEAVAAERKAKFGERMAALDEEFDLGNEERQLIASDVRDLSDEAFAAYLTKAKVLMKEKSKAHKAALEAEAAKKVPAKDDKKAGKKDDGKDKEDDYDEDDKSKASVKEAVASVKEDTGQSKLPNMVHVDENLMNEMREAFASSIRVEGKPIKSKKN